MGGYPNGTGNKLKICRLNCLRVQIPFRPPSVGKPGFSQPKLPKYAGLAQRQSIRFVSERSGFQNSYPAPIYQIYYI